MHQPIQMPCRLLNLRSHIIIAIEIEDVGYEVERVLVVLDIGVEAREVEAVGEVIFVDFAEIFVALDRDELVCHIYQISCLHAVAIRDLVGREREEGGEVEGGRGMDVMSRAFVRSQVLSRVEQLTISA